MTALRHPISLLAALLLMLSNMLVHAQSLENETPDALVKRVSEDVLDTIRKDDALRAGSNRHIRQTVEEKVLPYVDFRKTTALCAGRFWREATPEQQQQLVEAFRDLLIHTYSGALSQVGDQKLQFRPLQIDPAETDVQVRSQVIQAGREPIQLNYRLEKSADGWKIYDINIMGVWLTETYKGSFAAEVNRGGIDGLIRTLVEKNRQLAGTTGGSVP